LPQRYPGQGIAAFVDFYDVHSAVDTVQSAQTFSGREIRVNYKFKDGGGGPRFGGRQEQGSPHRDRERYSDKKSQRRYNDCRMFEQKKRVIVSESLVGITCVKETLESALRNCFADFATVFSWRILLFC